MTPHFDCWREWYSEIRGSGNPVNRERYLRLDALASVEKMVVYSTKSTSIDLARPSHVKQADVLPERAVEELPDPELYPAKMALESKSRKINPAILYAFLHFLFSTTDSGIIDLNMIEQIYSEESEEDETKGETDNDNREFVRQTISDTIDEYIVSNDLLYKTKRGGAIVYTLPDDIDVAPIFSDPTVDIVFRGEEIDTDELYRGQFMFDKLLTPLIRRWTSIRLNEFLIIGDTAFAVSVLWLSYVTTTLRYGVSDIEIVTASSLWALCSFALAAISVGLVSSLLNDHTTVLQRLHQLPRQLFGAT